ncbi:MAG: UDP-N-acetylmuramoyl-L-alanyl-D-glutamate--2,6-diaminopimelate ligase [Nitrosomonadaceae bacterium]|nr:UDP-N-acetylmuramoyl-L-alanyl-D-glutamate--2,6-diaminopimelate ligase [Nitrosomonadaceae bacterium]|tara:strand:- start:731 stop:2287 length:1557 start_codon:yes stop_codon:yes gene_type:complete
MNLGDKNTLEEKFDPDILNSMGISIENLITDSRMVKPGDTFLAYVGEKVDARKYIPQAIKAGANAVLWERSGFVWNPEWKIPNLSISKLRSKVGVIANHIYKNPSGKLCLIGVTGTNGKTSCVQWIAQALTEFDIKVASIGTLGSGFSGNLLPSFDTTPSPVLLQQRMADFLKQGAKYVVLEASSHGIAQGRINGSTLSVALFTNLSHDHLDYHGSMQAYAASKARLFHWDRLQHAVLNLDDVFGVELLKKLMGRAINIIGYGFKDLEIKDYDPKLFEMVHGYNLKVNSQGLEFDVVFKGERLGVKTELIGEFNASNLLAVLSTLLACGFNLGDAAKVLKKIQPISGRMEKFGGGSLPLVVVDFAHTPDALKKTLLALRVIISSSKDVSKIKNTKSKLICVFGCGGDRDQDKRALMGKIATELSDETIITSDNPRNEDPYSIINDISLGLDNGYFVEENREIAIRKALNGAHQGDVVLIAGKGHEEYQEIGTKKIPFSDVKMVRLILQELANKVQDQI